MPKKTVSAKIDQLLKKEADKIAAKRGITFSRLVEVALIHELNRKSLDNGLLAELKDIQEYVGNKISDLTVIDDVEVTVKDDNYYVEELKRIHNEKGFVSSEVILNISKKAGLSFKEFKSLLEDSDFTFIIK